MKSYWRNGCINPRFAELAPLGGEWSVSRSCRFARWIGGGWMGPRAGLDFVEKRGSLAFLGLELLVRGRYTDWATATVNVCGMHANTTWRQAIPFSLRIGLRSGHAQCHWMWRVHGATACLLLPCACCGHIRDTVYLAVPDVQTVTHLWDMTSCYFADRWFSWRQS